MLVDVPKPKAGSGQVEIKVDGAGHALGEAAKHAIRSDWTIKWILRRLVSN
jgi:hypothetical protein